MIDVFHSAHVGYHHDRHRRPPTDDLLLRLYLQEMLQEEKGQGCQEGVKGGSGPEKCTITGQRL